MTIDASNLDFSSMDGEISMDDLATPTPGLNSNLPNFASAPGSISAEALEKAEMAIEQQPIVPIPIAPTPQLNQTMSVTGNSGFDNIGMSNFLDNYGKKSASAQAQPQKQTNTLEQPSELSSSQQANILNELFSAPAKTKIVEETYYGDEEYEDEEYEDEEYEEYEDEESDDYLVTIEDIIEDEVQRRIAVLIDSGELVRKSDIKKRRVTNIKKNKYISDIADSLLNL